MPKSVHSNNDTNVSANTELGSQSKHNNALLYKVAQTQDEHAFSELYAFFAPRLKGFFLRTKISPELAEELAQETMLKIWRKAHLFDAKKASASTWVFTIARNIRIDSIRKSMRSILDEDEPSLKPPEEPRADEVAERIQRDEIIKEALGVLPKDQREVIQLYFFEDDPHSAIARKLNIPLGTVKSRLRLAFGKIKKELSRLE